MDMIIKNRQLPSRNRDMIYPEHSEQRMPTPAAQDTMPLTPIETKAENRRHKADVTNTMPL